MNYQPEQRQQIKVFMENKAMVEAVKAVLLAGTTEEGLHSYLLSLDRDMPNEEYGSRVKARIEAAHMVESGFAQLKQIASGVHTVQSTQNPAR